MALHFLDAFVRAERPRLPRSPPDQGGGLSSADVIINRAEEGNLRSLIPRARGRIFCLLASSCAESSSRRSRRRRPIICAGRKRVLRAMQNAISCSEDTTRERARTSERIIAHVAQRIRKDARKTVVRWWLRARVCVLAEPLREFSSSSHCGSSLADEDCGFGLVKKLISFEYIHHAN